MATIRKFISFEGQMVEGLMLDGAGLFYSLENKKRREWGRDRAIAVADYLRFREEPNRPPVPTPNTLKKTS